MIGEEIRRRLWALQDPAYRDFQCRLMPTVPRERVIGVRTPALRRLAAELARRPDIGEFLQTLPHRYYEEDNLHGFLVAGLRDYDTCVAALERFLPHVDNWATCDSMMPRCFRKRPEGLAAQALRWMAAEHTYTVRFGIGVLMACYLEEGFDPAYSAAVAALRSEAYYVNMMRAWYVATALAKQYDAVLPLIRQRRLDDWTHNKAIQKAVESYRITDEQKTYLRTLRVPR